MPNVNIFHRSPSDDYSDDGCDDEEAADKDDIADTNDVMIAVTAVEL